MRWFALKFWGLKNRRGSNRSRALGTRYSGHNRPRRLEFDTLEDRTVPSTATFGVLSGSAFVDHNGNGAFDSGEIRLEGVSVTLSGTTSTGGSFTQTTTTDSTGMFAFRDVTPGVYELSAAPRTGYLGGNGPVSFADLSGAAAGDIFGLPISQGQFATQNVSLRGLDPNFITASLFLNTTTQASFPAEAAGSTANNAPFVTTPIDNVVVAENAAATQIDLAGHFSDADIANSTIRMDLNTGQSLNLQLFNTTAPQTVANFMDYVNSGAYNSSFFHRLATSPSVLQGGGFTFDPSTSSINTITTLPPVPSEFGASNVADTIAMALTGPAGNPDLNSGTDQFYFNVGNNSASLDAQKFTVFGQLESAADNTVLQSLAGTTVRNESSFNGAFNTIPLSNYSGTNNDPNFPTNSTLSNYLAINDIAITSQNDFLTYSVVSNSNPGLVTTTLQGEHLTLSYAPNQSGVATITVQARDELGATAQTSFQVTVVPLTITPVPPVNVGNEKNTAVSGTAAPGATVSVQATDGTNTTPAVTTQADATTGAWMASVNVGSVKDGTITFTASTTDSASGKTVSVTTTTTKATVVPNLAISAVSVSPLTNTGASGTAPANASVSLTASDGTNPPVGPVTTMATTGGTWSASGLDISSLNPGLITYTATTTDSHGNTATATTQVSTSGAVTAPAIFITSDTNPINTTNQTTVSVSGTATRGASVSVVATDGTNTSTAVVVTADPSTGAWTASGINASSLSNGLITYRATATVSGDTNTAQATAQATKQP